MLNKTILVTGATGLLGRALTESVPAGNRVIGVTRGVTSGYIDSALQFMQTNVTNQDAVNRLFDKFQFDVVIHAAGEGSVDAVERDPILGRLSIVQGAENLASISKKHGARVIYISTNAVFSGDEAPYSEASEMRPLSLYGQLKREAEIVFLESDDRWSVVRPILMYGWPLHGQRTNPVAFTVSQLRAKQELKMVNDVWENPLYNIHCAEAIWQVMKKEVPGVMHLAGQTRLNRYELAVATAKAFRLDPDLIKEVDSSFFPTLAPRPRDTTFRVDRMIERLGMQPLSLNEGLKRMAANES
jgi:dTDP-4-dehydrorhamnose reductase